MPDPSIPPDRTERLALRAELALQAFELSHAHITRVARWLDLGDYAHAIEMLELALPFWKVALEEMRAIRTEIAEAKRSAEAAAEWARESSRRPRKTK